jgi:hypothetical protein
LHGQQEPTDAIVVDVVESPERTVERLLELV